MSGSSLRVIFLDMFSYVKVQYIYLMLGYIANIYSLLNLSESSIVGVLYDSPNQMNLAFYICIVVRETVE
jgi:hypothetical protein